MQYFKTSFKTLQAIAMQCGFDGLAGYLVLARHTTGRQVLHYPPHLLSGAGINGIHEKLGCSELRAKSILDSLIAKEFVVPAPSDANAAAPRSAKWMLPHKYPLDTDLPHDLVDEPTFAQHAKVNSPLKRLKKLHALPNQTKSQANLDGAMLLMGIYSKTKMQAFGGLPSDSTVYREWKVLSKKAYNDKLYEWKAAPETQRAYIDFAKECLPHISGDESEVMPHFWNALKNLTAHTRLVYEAVTLFHPTDKSILACLRVNDFHAGSNTHAQNFGISGDSSLFKSLEAFHNTSLAFYDLEAGEDMRIVLPFGEGKIQGIYRPRFRTSNQDTGLWVEEENLRVADAFKKISESAGSGDDDDF